MLIWNSRREVFYIMLNNIFIKICLVLLVLNAIVVSSYAKSFNQYVQAGMADMLQEENFSDVAEEKVSFLDVESLDIGFLYDDFKLTEKIYRKGAIGPFYETIDSNAIVLEIKCPCETETFDLSTKLVPYSNIQSMIYDCDAARFEQIPTMPSVTRLSSNVMTSNITAFPNLEIFRNNGIMETYKSKHYTTYTSSDAAHIDA